MDDLLTFAVMVVLAFLFLSQVDRKWKTRHQRKQKAKFHHRHARAH